MNTQAVAYHKWHVVSGPVGGTVTSVDGSVTFCTIPDGGQGAFYAVTTEVVVSDASISVDECPNFKCAPVKRWLLGLGRGANALPKGYLAAEFLESYGAEASINTGVYPNSETGWLVDGVFTANEESWPVSAYAPPNRYYFCCGFYGKGWGSVCVGQNGSNGSPISYDYEGNLRFAAYVNFKNSRSVNFEREGVVKRFELGAAISQMQDSIYVFGRSNNNCYYRMWKLKISQGGKIIKDYAMCLDDLGKPCLFDKLSKKAIYNTINKGTLIVGMTCRQAVQLAKLPAGGGTLTVSLPWDAQLDKKVDAALEAARSKGWTIVVQYQEPDVNSAVHNKYAACVTMEDLLAVNADYMNDLTADGKWIYPLSELGDVWQIFTSKSKVKRLCFSAPKMKDSGEICEQNNVEYVEIDVPNCWRLRWAVWRCAKVEEIRVNAPNLTNATLFAENCTNLKKFEGNIPKLSAAEGMFYGCQLDKASALGVLDNLPAYSSGSHAITMGIHIDYENDAEVLAARDNAEAKGWTVTVQWNGTATAQTASTWGLRRKPVYAKVREAELPDGTTERVLDWGHYVTNWEENGYQEFASVEEAREYFNIGD